MTCTGESDTILEVKKSNVPIDLKRGEHIVMNAEAAPAGDVFFMFSRDPPEPPLRVSIQAKKIAKSINSELYNREKQKSAEDKDFFLLVSTGSKDKNLEMNSQALTGLVAENNFEEFFGDLFATGFRNWVPPSNIAEWSSEDWIHCPGVGSQKAVLLVGSKTLKEALDQLSSSNNISENVKHFIHQHCQVY